MITPEREAPDSAEIDALSELAVHPGYRLVVERVEAELTRRCLELERPMDLANTAELRGRIMAFRTVLAIPNILKQEIAGKLRR